MCGLAVLRGGVVGGGGHAATWPDHRALGELLCWPPRNPYDDSARAPTTTT